MGEIQHAIATQLGENKPMRRVSSPHLIVEVCVSLIRHDEGSGIVEFSHESVREFLAEKCSTYILSDTFISQICLTYLSFDEFDEVTLDADGLKQRIVHFPFGEYAASFWAMHVKGDGESDEEIVKLLLKFAESAGKVSSTAELVVADFQTWETPPDDPEDKGERRFSTFKLIHFLAENDLTILTQNLLFHRDVRLFFSLSLTPGSSHGSPRPAKSDAHDTWRMDSST